MLDIPARGVREERHKDLFMILKATEKLIQSGEQKLKPIVQKYKRSYNRLTKTFREDDMSYFVYKRMVNQMILDFVAETNSLYAKKVA